MLFSTQGFQGTLSKFAYKNKGDGPSEVHLLVKHTSEGEIQNFLDDLEKIFNRENIKSLFLVPLHWDKAVINKSGMGFPVSLTFDEVEFDALLTTITVNRKFKQGVESFEYSMLFEKEVDADNLDKVLVTEYLNTKHENEDGKKVLTMFQVKLKRAEDKKDTVLN